MKLKEFLENKLDQLNYDVSFSNVALNKRTALAEAKEILSNEIGCILDSFLYIGVTDEYRAEKICHYLEIRFQTYVNENENVRLKFREELLKIHKELVNWEEQK